MNANNKINFQDWLAILVLALAPFSFAPSIALPLEDFSSFRIGLYQLLLAFFTSYSLWRQRTQTVNLLRTNRWLQAALASLAAVIGWSLIATLDMSRTLLLSASVALLSASTLAMYVFYRSLSDSGRGAFLRKAAQWIVGVGVAVSVVGIVQFVLGSFDQGVVADGLCAGCSGGVFGFPRINVFAAEPQFFANALLPALLIALVRLKGGFKPKPLLIAIVVVFAFSLSFSRGANLALIAALLIMGWQLYRRQQLRRWLQGITVVVAGFVLAAMAMITSNYLQFRNENPQIVAETFETLVEHGSAGLIELDIRENPEVENKSATEDMQPASMSEEDSEPFAPPQQIEASGDERLEAARVGLSLLDSPQRMLLGVGFGNIGPYALSQDLSVPSDLTIYIQYALVLAEVGTVGLVLFVALHVLAARRAFNVEDSNSSLQVALAAILVGFMVQYFFFGTYINAGYVWLYLGLGLALQGKHSQKLIMLD